LSIIFAPSLFILINSLMQKRFKAVLFDMDGTLVDSTLCIERLWRKWSQRHNLDESYVLSQVHGRRGYDTICLVAPHLNPDEEILALLTEEAQTLDGTVPIAGADIFVKQLPRNRWGLVTSAPSNIAMAKLSYAGIILPEIIVSAEDVTFGKPHPEPYLLGAELLGVTPSECLVFEDARQGIQSALAAGMTVIALASHQQSSQNLHSAHGLIKDYNVIDCVYDNDWIEISIAI
jgi:sugar-phosphatase